MKKECSNASTERILALLILLLQGEFSRNDIFMNIAEYERGAEPSSQQKMLLRDLSTLERVGIHVKHQLGKDGVMRYSALLPPSKPRHLIRDNDMLCKIWDAAILPRF